MELHLFIVMAIGTNDSGDYIISEKFVEGVKEYLKYWPGDIIVHAPHSNVDNANYMDGGTYAKASLPFKIDFTPFEHPDLIKSCHQADLIVAGLEYNLIHLNKISKDLGIPLIFIAETTYETKKQILKSENINFLIKLRRLYWLFQMNKKFETAVKEADGLQCNGTPTYEAYAPLNTNNLLFFDSRITQNQLASLEDIQKRTTRTSQTLRLAFSGRLIAIKGVNQLVPMAKELRDLGVNFHLDICGDGKLKEKLIEDINKDGLDSNVRVKGRLDFTTEWIPYMKTSVDVFVSPHVQGDPSCTYLEVMSCGVPIVGYDNEAFEGLVKLSGTGWLTPLNKPKALALKIKELSKERQAIVEASQTALGFSTSHTFEKTFKARVDHFINTVKTKKSSNN